MSHAIAQLFSGISETKQALVALGSVLALGILVGGLGVDALSTTPELARQTRAAVDSIRPIVYANATDIDSLQIVDDERDDQMERIEDAIEDIRLHQCLTLAELRGDVNTDRCRNE